MKTFLWLLAIITLLVGCAIFIQKHSVPYEISGVCKKLITTQSRDGDRVYYKVIIQYADGSVEELDVDGRSFFTYKENQTYYFERSRFVWDKK